MTTFYLFFSKTEHRRILTETRPAHDFEDLREIEAETWEAARAQVDKEVRPTFTLEQLFTQELSPHLPPTDAPFPA